jgi:UDP-N-acetyl-2-amino-2-deoxyglucuronate dehydrogenase
MLHPRIGILGGGGILNSHAPAYRRLTDLCTVTVVAEPNPDRANIIRELLHPGVRIVKDYREAVAADDVDAVDVLLPHNLHMPATIEAAQAGKPVLVEKVMARNVWECDRMIEACDCEGVTLTVCHDRRYDPAWRMIKDVVDSGALGRIFFWRLNHNQDVTGPPGHWLRSRDALGGGAIMSCLTHQIDALRWYGGEVDCVSCMTRSDTSRMEGEFLGVVTAGMQSGALAELAINWWTSANRGDPNLWYEMVHVCGTGGEAYTMYGRGSFVKLHDRDNAGAIERYGEAALDRFVQLPTVEGSGHYHCIREWVLSLRGEPSSIITSGRECRGTVEVAEAAYLAETSARTVRLPIKPAPWPASTA